MSTAKDFLLDEVVLEKALKAVEGSIAKTLSTSIGKEVKVVYKKTFYHTIGEAQEYKGAQYILVSGNFSGAIKGPFYFLMPTAEALYVAGTLMMLSQEELSAFITKGYTAEAEDGFKESMSQVVGQVGTALRAIFKDVSPSGVTTKEINILESFKEFEQNIEGDEIVLVSFECGIGDKEPFEFYFTLSKELAFSMAPASVVAEEPVVNAEVFSEDTTNNELEKNIEVIRKIKVPVIVTLSQKKITIEEIFKQIAVGSIIEFNVAFDSYLDLQVGEQKIGECEVITLNDSYGVQIKSVLSARETLLSLL